MGSCSKLRLKQEGVLNSIVADLLLMTAQQNIQKKTNNGGPLRVQMQLVHAW